VNAERAFRGLERRLPEPEPSLVAQILQTERRAPDDHRRRRRFAPIVATATLVASLAMAVVAVVSRAPDRLASSPQPALTGSVLAAVRVTGTPTTLPPGAFGEVDGAQEIVATSVRSIGPAVTFTLTNGDVCIGVDHGVAGAPRVWVSCYPATYAGVLLTGWIGPHTIVGVTSGEVVSVVVARSGTSRPVALRSGVFSVTVDGNESLIATTSSGAQATVPLPPRTNAEALPGTAPLTSLLATAGTASGRGRLLAQAGATTYRAWASSALGRPLVCLEIGGGRTGGSACVPFRASATGFALTCGRTAIVLAAAQSAFVDDMLPPGQVDAEIVNHVAVIRVPLAELGHRWFAATAGARHATGARQHELIPVYAVPVPC
jgi:hypothetical protein